MPIQRISKQLSANDTGDTGGHQSGILVPKDPKIIGFFPRLDSTQHNPRCLLNFMDNSGRFWEFSFIYYNNARVGGTRNEFRLTRMTAFIREAGLVPGDEVVLSRDERGRYLVTYRRRKAAERTPSGALKLGSGWRVVPL